MRPGALFMMLASTLGVGGGGGASLDGRRPPPARSRFADGYGGGFVAPPKPHEPTEAEIEAEAKRARRRARNLARCAS